jgi:hypothetical protein
MLTQESLRQDRIRLQNRLEQGARQSNHVTLTSQWEDGGRLDSGENGSSLCLMSGRRYTSRLACRKWLNLGVLRGVALEGECREQSGG